MDNDLCFIRYEYNEDSVLVGRHFYWAISVHGQRVRIIEAHHQASGHVFYQVVSSFWNNSQHLLGLGNNRIFITENALYKWLEALIHNSFVLCSEPGILRCWYKKTISQNDMQGPMLLPPPCIQDFNTLGRTDWILVRHGALSWPMQVINNQMLNDWQPFCDYYLIQPDYTLLLVCERRWVFNSIILGPDGHEIWHTWATTRNPYFRTLYAPPGLYGPPDIRTSFALTELQDGYPLNNSGYSYVPGINHQEEFENSIQVLLHNADVDSVRIRMNQRTWAIPLQHGHLNPQAFGQFITALELQTDDYIFISVRDVRDIRVVVFEADEGAERLYDWI